ncbi:tetratricopeptide repeat protein [Thermodesulfobacteriota bacterium]
MAGTPPGERLSGAKMPLGNPPTVARVSSVVAVVATLLACAWWVGATLAMWRAENLFRTQYSPLWMSLPESDVPERITTLCRAADLDPGNAELHFELGRAWWLRMGRQWSGGAWIWHEGRLTYVPPEAARQDGIQAVRALSQAVDLEPTNPWYHLNLGLLCRQVEPSLPCIDPGTAARHLETALWLRPHDSVMRNLVLTTK